MSGPLQRRTRVRATLAAVALLATVGCANDGGSGRDSNPDSADQLAMGSEPEPTAAEARAHQLDLPTVDTPLDPGGCRWLPPTGVAKDRTVFVDAGHGGYDPGAAGIGTDGGQILERTATLAVARKTSSLLRAAGYAVVMSRLGDEGMLDLPHRYLNGKLLSPEGVRAELRARAACANAGDADALVSIHFNSYGDPGVGGVETLYDPDREFSAESKRLARLVQSELVTGYAHAGLDVSDRGSHEAVDLGSPALTDEGAAYGHLIILGPRERGYNDNPSRMPGVVTEPSFVTCPAEADFVSSPSGQRVVASAIAAGVERFLSPH